MTSLFRGLVFWVDPELETQHPDIDSDEAIERLGADILEHGGQVIDEFDAEVCTHIVCSSACEDSKVAELYDANKDAWKCKPVAETWVSNCMHLGKLIPEVCVDGMTPNAKMTTDKGRHVFSGVVSSISKVSDEEYKRIKHEIERGGGEVHDGLFSGCTHLIVGAMAGRKYQWALNHSDEQISIVHPSWVWKSKEAGEMQADEAFDPRCATFPNESDGSNSQSSRSIIDSFDLSVLLRGDVFVVENVGEDQEVVELGSMLEEMGARQAVEGEKATIIVTSSRNDMLDSKKTRVGAMYRTPLWVRECHGKRATVFLDGPEQNMRNLLFCPFPSTSIEGSSDMQITLTGFQGQQRETIKQLIKLTGAQQTNTMTKSNTHLLCLSHDTHKYTAAVKWGLHVVSHVWLFDSILMWKWMDVGKYLESGQEEVERGRWTHITAEQVRDGALVVEHESLMPHETGESGSMFTGGGPSGERGAVFDDDQGRDVPAAGVSKMTAPSSLELGQADAGRGVGVPPGGHEVVAVEEKVEERAGGFLPGCGGENVGGEYEEDEGAPCSLTPPDVGAAVETSVGSAGGAKGLQEGGGGGGGGGGDLGEQPAEGPVSDACGDQGGKAGQVGGDWKSPKDVKGKVPDCDKKTKTSPVTATGPDVIENAAPKSASPKLSAGPSDACESLEDGVGGSVVMVGGAGGGAMDGDGVSPDAKAPQLSLGPASASPPQGLGEGRGGGKVDAEDERVGRVGEVRADLNGSFGKEADGEDGDDDVTQGGEEEEEEEEEEKEKEKGEKEGEGKGAGYVGVAGVKEKEAVEKKKEIGVDVESKAGERNSASITLIDDMQKEKGEGKEKKRVEESRQHAADDGAKEDKGDMEKEEEEEEEEEEIRTSQRSSGSRAPWGKRARSRGGKVEDAHDVDEVLVDAEANNERGARTGGKEEKEGGEEEEEEEIGRGRSKRVRSSTAVWSSSKGGLVKADDEVMGIDAVTPAREAAKASVASTSRTSSKSRPTRAAQGAHSAANEDVAPPASASRGRRSTSRGGASAPAAEVVAPAAATVASRGRKASNTVREEEEKGKGKGKGNGDAVEVVEEEGAVPRAVRGRRSTAGPAPVEKERKREMDKEEEAVVVAEKPAVSRGRRSTSRGGASGPEQAQGVGSTEAEASLSKGRKVSRKGSSGAVASGGCEGVGRNHAGGDQASVPPSPPSDVSDAVGALRDLIERLPVSAFDQGAYRGEALDRLASSSSSGKRGGASGKTNSDVNSKFWTELQGMCERIASSVLGAETRPTKLWQKGGDGEGVLGGVASVELLEDAINWKVVSKLLVQQRKEEREREDKDKDKVPISSVISVNTESSASAPLPKSKHHGRARQATPPPCTEPCRSTSSSPVIANEVRVRASQTGGGGGGGRLVLVCGGEATRERMCKTVKHLKGRAAYTHSFDPDATHILCRELKRTEKLLCGLSSGKWILQQEYIAECEAQGRWVSEAPFEWHNARKFDADARVWHGAPRRWREWFASKGHGPFAGQHYVIMPGTNPPSDVLRQIIVSGSGGVTVLGEGGSKVPKANQCASVVSSRGGTHALFREDTTGEDEAVGAALGRGGNVVCVRASWLLDWLLLRDLPDPTQAAYAVGVGKPMAGGGGGGGAGGKGRARAEAAAVAGGGGRKRQKR